MERKHSFAAVVDARTRLLVLGSLPGDKSLAQSQYYAHPQNRFWQLMGAVIGLDLPALAYEDRLTTLLDHGVGLWDVIANARRDGSLDTNIKDLASNDLPALVARLPLLTTIAFNGGTAARLGTKVLQDQAARYRLLTLPSSSAAHTLPLSAKLVAWSALAGY